MDARQLTANLSDHHKTELIAASAQLLPPPARLPDSVLDAFALRLRIEPPRPRDLPTLPPKSVRYFAPALVEQVRHALRPPPPVTLIGREAELSRAVQALCQGQAVCVAPSGIGKTAFLRALAADARLRAHFSHVWWLGTPLADETFMRLLALALNVPDALDARPEAALSTLRSAVYRAKALLLCDWAPAEAWSAALGPYILWQGDAPDAELIRLDALPESTVLGYLAAQAGLAEPEGAALAALIGGSPALLRLSAALLVEDDFTLPLLLDFLRQVPPEERYTALLSESISSFPAEYRAICYDLAATPVKCLPSALIAARLAHPVAARRALSFLARRRLIQLHATSEGELCSVLFDLPASRCPPESTPFDVSAPDLKSFESLAYVEDEQAARAAFLQGQGLALIDENRPEEAYEALTQALAIRQKLNLPYAIAETLSALGRLAYLNGDAAAAISQLETAAQILHDLHDTVALENVRLALCRAYAFQGRFEAALAIADDESVPAADLAALHRACGAWSAALEHYERALSDQADEDSWLAAQVGRAETLILAGRPLEALRSAPASSFAAMWARALAAHLSGDLSSALSAYADLEAVTPHAWRGIVARAKARALAAAGNLREAALLVGAEGVWYEARQLHPAFARQRLSLALYAQFCLMLGEDDEARRAAEEARAIRLERPDLEAEAIACCVLGRLAWRDGTLDSAVIAFEAALKALTALRDDQTRAQLLHLLGDLHRENGDLERTIACYRRALSFASGQSLLTHLALAEALDAAGRHAEALEAGAEAITALHPQRQSADLGLLGFAYARQADRQARFGRSERAQVIGDQWLHILAARLEEALAHPEPALNALAIGLRLRADWETALAEHDPIALIDQAERASQVAEQRAPNSLAVWAARRDLAELYRRLGRNGEAMEVLAPLIAFQRAHHSQIAAAHQLTWRDIFLCGTRASCLSAETFSYYLQVHQYEPDPHARGLISLEWARLNRRAGEAQTAPNNEHCSLAVSAYEGAAFQFRQAGDDKRLAETLAEAGEFCAQIGQYGKAIKALKGALRIFERTTRPTAARMAQLYAALGTAQANVGRARQAAEAFKQALRLIDQFSAPEHYAAILTAFARAEMRLKAYQSAATAYQEVLQFDHAPAERQRLLAELGKALRKLNQHEAAARVYQQALDIPEGDPMRRVALERALAECCLALNDYDAAQQHYERAIAQAPKPMFGILWAALGDLQRRRLDLQAALAAYTQALAQLNWRRRPSHTIAAERAIGEIYLALQQPDQALPHLERAFKLETWRKRKVPSNLIALSQLLAAAHEQRGDLQRAAAYHHSALVYQDEQRDPEAALTTLSELQRLYAQLGQHNEVLRVCTEALRLEKAVLHPNPERLNQTYLMFGRAQRALGMLAAALESFRQALQSAASPEAAHALAEVRAEIARHEQALAAATQSRALLERAPLPDLYSLVFVIALQLQHSLPLGRHKDALAYRTDLMKLLRQRRHELTFATESPTAQALLALLRGDEAGEARQAAAEYRAALELLRREAQPNTALLKVLEYLLAGTSA